MHPASLQLIGIPQSTTRRFGYCGNDFAAIKQLDQAHLAELDKMVREVGAWLYLNGYIGAFGIDALLYKDKVYLTEINPRFQGSTLVTALLDAKLGRPDMYISHLAAFLELEPYDSMTLPELTMAQPAMGHVVMYNKNRVPTCIDTSNLHTNGVRYRLQPEANIKVHPDAITYQGIFHGAITADGNSLLPECSRLLDAGNCD